VKKRWTFIVEIAILLAIAAWVGNIVLSKNDSAPEKSVEIKAPLSNAKDSVSIFETKSGALRYRVVTKDGKPIDYTPDEFTQLYYKEGRTRATWQKVLNITSPEGVVWVFLGLLGQVLFTGRMVVQLLASEKEKKSVVPPAFWWMSLAGASMLLVYFAWRRDPIGLLGQSFGWFIYVRNLYLIYAKTDELQSAVPAGQELTTEPDPA